MIETRQESCGRRPVGPPAKSQIAPVVCRGLVGLILAVLLLGTSGCRFFSTDIARIQAEPRKFQGRETTVSGRVEAIRWLPEIGVIGFRLVEGRDSLLVLTTQVPPAAGEEVRLSGRIARSFPIAGEERVVLYYRIDGNGRDTPQVDVR